MADRNPREDDIKKARDDANADPLSDRAGAHPVGTGIGAAVGGTAAGVGGGMAAGAAAGSAAGPVGTAVGAAIGAAVGAIGGGLAGKAIAEAVNPTVEHGYWSQTYASRPYVAEGTAYDRYARAYQYGWESQARHPNETFEESEPRLRSEWEKMGEKSKLEWNEAREAVRDSWERVARRRGNNPQ